MESDKVREGTGEFEDAFMPLHYPQVRAATGLSAKKLLQLIKTGSSPFPPDVLLCYPDGTLRFNPARWLRHLEALPWAGMQADQKSLVEEKSQSCTPSLQTAAGRKPSSGSRMKTEGPSVQERRSTKLQQTRGESSTTGAERLRILLKITKPSEN